MHPYQAPPPASLDNDTIGGGTNNSNPGEASENDVTEQQVNNSMSPLLPTLSDDIEQGDQLVPTMPEAEEEITPPTPKKPKPSSDGYEIASEGNRRSAAHFLFNWINATSPNASRTSAAPSGEQDESMSAALSLFNWRNNAALSGELEELSNAVLAPSAGQVPIVAHDVSPREAPEDDDLPGRPLSPPYPEPSQRANATEFQNRLLDRISRRNNLVVSQTDRQSVEDVLEENVLVDL